VRALVFGLLLLTVAVGCGEEDPIPLSEYIDRANEVCHYSNTEERADLQRLYDEATADGLDRDEVQEINREVLERARDSTERLAEIPPPDERRADAEAYERGVEEANDAFEDMIEAIDDGDSERAGEANDRNDAAIEKAKDVAGDLGLDECAET
jgi:hypothetical protein